MFEEKVETAPVVKLFVISVFCVFCGVLPLLQFTSSLFFFFKCPEIQQIWQQLRENRGIRKGMQ